MANPFWEGKDSKPLTFEEIQRAIASLREKAIKPDRFGNIHFCLVCQSFTCDHATRAGRADAN